MHKRNKFYFLDYTPFMKKAKRLHEFIIAKSSDNYIEISIRDILNKLNWGNQICNDRKAIMSKDEKLSLIDEFFKVLKELEFISTYEKVNPNPDSILETYYKISINNTKEDFDTVVSHSAYHPLKGMKQELTDEHLGLYEEKYKINYLKFLELIDKNQSYEDIIGTFIREIEYEWEDAYRIMTNQNINSMQYKNGSFWALFDHASMRDENQDILSDKYVSDRTIANYGFSTIPIGQRHKNDHDMKYYYENKWADKNTDRGHYISHAIGGEIYDNIFYQKRELNQGRSEEGRKFREMEKYLAKNSGTFCFARPIYFDFYVRPYLLEFGIVKKNLELWVEVFVNV